MILSHAGAWHHVYIIKGTQLGDPWSSSAWVATSSQNGTLSHEDAGLGPKTQTWGVPAQSATAWSVHAPTPFKNQFYDSQVTEAVLKACLHTANHMKTEMKF